MRHLLLHRFALFCLAAFGTLFAPVIGAAPKPVPFQATVFFSEQVELSTDPSAPCLLIGTISGRGTADRLGAVDLASRDCIVPLAPTLYLFTSRQVVLTLAHGDEIWAAYGGTLSAESGAITGTYLIYGGTGRFANATGAGTLRGFETLDLATGAGTGRIELRGTLAH